MHEIFKMAHKNGTVVDAGKLDIEPFKKQGFVLVTEHQAEEITKAVAQMQADADAAVNPVRPEVIRKPVNKKAK